MDENKNGRHRITTIVVFTINFLLWASGILLIVFGGVSIGSPSTIINILDLVRGVSVIANIFNVEPLFDGVADFMITLGSVLFLFGGIGCHGVWKTNKRMIMCYWLMLIIGVLTDIALIVYAAIFPETMNTYVQEQMYSALVVEFQPVTIESNDTIAMSSNLQAASWETLQFETHCCGAISFADYATFNWTKSPMFPNEAVPPSCCTNDLSPGEMLTNTAEILNINGCLGTSHPLNSTIYTTGCWLNVISMVWQFDYIAIAISACLMVAQLISIFVTIHSWKRMVQEDAGKV